MNRWFLLLILTIAIYLSTALQEFIPPLNIFWGARVLLVPIFFCFGALELPLLLMLPLAVFTGLANDLTNLHVINGQVEIAVGWSIILYVLVGCILQGVRPLYLRGHWELFAFGSALCIIFILTCQFLMLSFRRMESTGLIFHWIVFARIFIPGSIALLLSPLIYMAARLCHLCHQPRRLRSYA